MRCQMSWLDSYIQLPCTRLSNAVRRRCSSIIWPKLLSTEAKGPTSRPTYFDSQMEKMKKMSPACHWQVAFTLHSLCILKQIREQESRISQHHGKLTLTQSVKKTFSTHRAATKEMTNKCITQMHISGGHVVDTCCKHFVRKHLEKKMSAFNPPYITATSSETTPGLPMRQHKHGAPIDTITKAIVSLLYTVSQRRLAMSWELDMPNRS